MIQRLKRPDSLSIQMPRVRFHRVESQSVMVDDKPFSGVGYALVGECTYEAVQIVDGTVAGPFDDPLLPPGPYVDLDDQPGSSDDHDESLDWHYLGEPFSGVAIQFAPTGHLDHVSVVENAIPRDEYSFEESGAVRHRRLDQQFDPGVADGLSHIRQSIGWSPSGDFRRCHTSLAVGETAVSAELSVWKTASVSISSGYFQAVQEHRDQLEALLPFIDDDLSILSELTEAADVVRLGLGDRSAEVVERLATVGYLSAAKELRLSVYSGGMAGLRAAVALQLPALQSVTAAPARIRGQVGIGELDVLEVLLDLKRREPQRVVSFDTSPVRTVSELSVEQEPDDGLYFDDGCQQLMGTVGGITNSHPELLEHIVTAPSLQFAKMSSAPMYEEMATRLQARNDVAQIESGTPASTWLPGVLRRLNSPTS